MRSSLLRRSSAFLAILPMLFAAPVLAAERRFPVGTFGEVVLSGSPDVVVTTGAAHSVRAQGAEADLDRLDIRLEGNRLIIATKSGSGNWSMREGVTVRVSAPNLSGASISGSGDMQVGAVKGDFAARISGSGDMQVAAVDAPTLALSTSGSGDMMIGGGRCGAGTISTTGSGDVDAARVRCETLTVSTTGSGDVAAQATGTATLRTTGSGDIRVTGGARCSTRSSGSGNTACS
ncbi:MAG: head GIN domain-containing protein [Sandaracinobacter sp.]